MPPPPTSYSSHLPLQCRSDRGQKARRSAMEDMAIGLRDDVEQIVLSLGSDFAITYDQLRDNAKNNEVIQT